MAPFLGAWLVSALGLAGVLALDGISFVLAIGCVLAPWGEARLPHRRSRRRRRFHGMPGSGYVGCSVDGGSVHRCGERLCSPRNGVMGVYGACEIVFPAWVAAGWGSTRMGEVLVLATGERGIWSVSWPGDWGSACLGNAVATCCCCSRA